MKSKLLSAVAIIAAIAAVLSLGLNAQRVSDVAIIRLRVDDIERRLDAVEHAKRVSENMPQSLDMDQRPSVVVGRVSELERR